MATTGILEVGRDVDGNVVVNHPDLKPDADGVGHIVFSTDQARTLAWLLLHHAAGGKRPAAPLVDILDQLRAHVEDADAKHAPYNSAHEAYGVLMEEVRELEAHIFTRQKNRDVAAMRAEAIDIATVMIRFIQGVCDGGKARV